MLMYPFRTWGKTVATKLLDGPTGQPAHGPTTAPVTPLRSGVTGGPSPKAQYRELQQTSLRRFFDTYTVRT